MLLDRRCTGPNSIGARPDRLNEIIGLVEIDDVNRVVSHSLSAHPDFRYGSLDLAGGGYDHPQKHIDDCGDHQEHHDRSPPTQQWLAAIEELHWGTAPCCSRDLAFRTGAGKHADDGGGINVDRPGSFEDLRGYSVGVTQRPDRPRIRID